MKTFFDITTINQTVINNRFFVAPMSRVSADLNGVPSPEMCSYYTSFAEGGFGAIITEGLYTDEFYSRSYPNQPGIINKQQTNAWRDITDRIHQYATVIIAQLMHSGSISQALKTTKAPSRIIPLGEGLAGYGNTGAFPVPDEMTVEDIRMAVDGFVNAGMNAVAAGFDGIELHAANGYLLDQFITPYLNLRNDHYGGTVKNRLRIIKEIVEGIRDKVPAGFIIGLRISEGKVNNLTYRWEGGSKAARAIMEEIKVIAPDYLHIAAEHFGWQGECIYDDGTTLTGLAKEILSCPVVANGKLHDLALAQQLLNTNQADFLSIGKYALSNPDFVKKAAAGKALIPFDSKIIHPNPSLFSGFNKSGGGQSIDMYH